MPCRAATAPHPGPLALSSMAEDLTPAEVARLTGLSESRVRALLREGRLAGERTPDGWRVSSDAVGPLVEARGSKSPTFTIDWTRSSPASTRSPSGWGSSFAGSSACVVLRKSEGSCHFYLTG